MKTIQVNAYSFDELSKEVQLKVINDNVSINADNCSFRYEEALETAEQFCYYFGVRFDNDLYPNFNFTDDEILNLRGEELRTHLNALIDLETYLDCPLTGNSNDITMLFELKHAGENETFKEVVKSAFFRLRKQLENDNDYLCSEEAIEDTIISLDMLFTEKGAQLQL